MDGELFIDTTQLDEFWKIFPHLADELKAEMVEAATGAAADLIKAEMVLLAPMRVTPKSPHSRSLRPGAVKENIRKRLISDGGGWLVGPNAFVAYVVRWLEFGHRVRLSKKLRARKIKAKTAEVQPYPFLRRAYDGSKAAAAVAAQRRLAADIAKLYEDLTSRFSKVV